MTYLQNLEWHFEEEHTNGIDEISGTGRPITIGEACSLRNLLFGDLQRSFGREWTEQSFHFKRCKPFSYGIIQKRGGPCGVLAVVQAYVLREFLFGYHKVPLTSGLLNPTLQQKRTALSLALTRMLWTIGKKRNVLVALKGKKKVLNNTLISEDGMLEYVRLKKFNCKTCLLYHFHSCIDEMMKDDNGSCVLFLYSMILTRGVEEVKKDAGNSEQLIGLDGFASQEIVNLLLVSKAVPNLFDRNQVHDLGGSRPSLLHGIPHRSDIGLLSNLEPHCEVGSYYKNPKYPIFLLICDHHYTVLFGTSKEILNDSEDEFILVHYDGFLKTETFYSIEPYGKASQNQEDNGEIVSVVKCISSRWPEATIFEQNEESSTSEDDSSGK